MPPVLTDKIAVVLWCSHKDATCYLQTFDLATGNIGRNAHWSRMEGDASTPYLHPQSKDSFVVSDGALLTEYDNHLKPRTRLRLPGGIGLAPAPGYGYSDWSRITNLHCTPNLVSLFNLVGGRKLVVGCGAMGLLDPNWKLIFAEKYDLPDGLGWPVLSQDGGRFILPVQRGYVEPPLHETAAFILYDVRSKVPREFVFRTADEFYRSGYPALSPDGKKFALLDKSRLAVYELPD